MILNFCKYLIIHSLLISSAYSVEVSRGEFLKQVSKAVGTYKVISGPKKFCDSGQLSFVDDLSPESGLRLSGKIFLGPFAEKTVSTKEEGYCTITEEYKYTTNSVKQITRVHSCKEEHIRDESVATQGLEIKGRELIYRSLESKIECRYQKVDGERE